jgi:hypothetical protein
MRQPSGPDPHRHPGEAALLDNSRPLDSMRRNRKTFHEMVHFNASVWQCCGEGR